MIAYFDTSALLKMLLLEVGVTTAITVWEAADARIAARIAYPEARAGLTAAARAGRLTGRQHRAARSELAMRFREVDVAELTQAVAEAAGDLSEGLALRGYDAVHLASAILVGERTVLVTWDRALARAGVAIGLDVIPRPRASSPGGSGRPV